MFKKLYGPALLLTALFGLYLVSCKKDSDVVSAERLIGKWTINQAIGNYSYENNINRDTTYFTVNDFAQFNPDHTVQIEESGNLYAGKWVISNNKLVITGSSYMDYPGGFAVAKLNNNSLELVYSEQDNKTSLEQKLTLKK